MNTDARHRVAAAQRALVRARRTLQQLRIRMLSAERSGRDVDAVSVNWALEDAEKDVEAAHEYIEQAVVMDDAKGTAA